MNPLPFDELNTLDIAISRHFGEDGKIKSEQDKEDMVDEMFELFLLATANGVEQINEAMNGDYHPGMTTVTDIVDRRVAGKTWRERVDDYYANGGTKADIMRIAETETHRDSNEASFIAAKANGATKKTWHCLLLPTSRDSHIYLDGVSAPIDGEFYSINGGSTQFPGEWGIAEEDCNCYCYLTYQ